VAPTTTGAPPVAPAAPATAATPPAKRFDFSPGGSPAPTGANVGGMPVTDMQLAPSGGATPSGAGDNTADEKAEYETALGILRDGRYSDAALAFKQFIAHHPTGSYTDNAYYWLGETYYVTRDFDQALSTFRELTTRFPQSPKVADSHLKIGFIYYEKQDWKASRSELENVVSTWPTSTAARLANERLARMKQEHH
jgi:tol-pal system protein YbgF